MAAYATAWLVTHRVCLAFAAGLAVTLTPGVIGRNYMGSRGLLGMLTMLRTFVLPAKSRMGRIFSMIATGLAISLAWLIRIDLGFFQTILFLLAAQLFVLRPEAGVGRRLVMAMVAFLILGASFLAIQGPVYRDAIHRGFGREFSEQYWVWPAMIRNAACKVATDLSKLHPVSVTKPPGLPAPSSSLQGSPTPLAPLAAPSPLPVVAAAPASSPKKSETVESDSTASFSDASLKRPAFADILHSPHFKDRVFALLIYLPLLVSGLFIARGLGLAVFSLLSRDPRLWEEGGVLLLCTGSSLVLFPQYFFWRPDMVHLGEFMVPFMVTLILGMSLSASAATKCRLTGRLFLSALVIIAGLNLGIYLVKGWATDGTGSIAASRRRHSDFTAANGVHVRLNSQEFSRDSFLRDTILRYSAPGDFVVCYPYFPMVNFMTDRPSYEYNLYADNAIAPDRFFDQETRSINRYHPAVVVIGTGRINSAEASRFRNWASRTYAYIREHFILVASDEEVEIYARNPARAPTQSSSP